MDLTQRQVTENQIVVLDIDFGKANTRRLVTNPCLMITLFALMLLVIAFSALSYSLKIQKSPSEILPEVHQQQLPQIVQAPAANSSSSLPISLPLPPKPKPQHQQKKGNLFDFDAVIQKKKQFVQRIESSRTHFECLEIEPLFHVQDYGGFNNAMFDMYFQTIYEVMLPACNNEKNWKWSVNRQNIAAWNADRSVVEWALHSLGQREKILYHREGVYNIPEIIMLTKRAEHLTVVQSLEAQECVRKALRLSGVPNNVEFVASNQVTSLKYYSAIVANEQLLARFNEALPQSTKVLVYSKKGQELKKNNILRPFDISKFVLTKGPCGKGAFEDRVFGEGFFSVNSQKGKRNLWKKSIEKQSTFGALEPKYAQFKQNARNKLLSELRVLQDYQRQSLCIDPKSQRVYPSFVYTIYGHRLFEATLEQLLLWEERREAVEWLRPQSNSGFSVYYEVSAFNLLAIVQIAFMLREGTLTVVCEQSECARIKTQVDRNSLANVKLLSQTSEREALLSKAVITDNTRLINACVRERFLERGSLLGFFPQSRNESVEAARRLFVSHELREVFTPNARTECGGFEYRNFFWNWEELNAFYEIRPSKYVVYSFWGGSPKDIPNRKKFIVEELCALDVEAKVVSPQLFKYFEVPHAPIHPAFDLLTSVHKSDYFRGYVMHNYGGGYSDVKHSHFKWRPYFEEFQKDEKSYIYGYHEIVSWDVACYDSQKPPCPQIQSYYNRFAGNCYFIMKKQSPLSTEWFNAVNTTLNNIYQELKKNPPRVPRQVQGGTFYLKDGTRFVSKYPLRWAQMVGEKLSRAQYKYIGNVKSHMPYIIVVDYRNQVDNN